MASNTANKSSLVPSLDYNILTKTGMTLLKFNRSGRPREKIFKLTGDHLILYWQSRIFSFKFGKMNKLDFEKVVRIDRGQTNEGFTKFKHIYGPAENKSLTIVYYGDNGTEESLNVICPSQDTYNYFMLILKEIINEIDKEKTEISFDKRYLRTLWRLADSDHSGSLTWEEICKVILPLLRIDVTAEIRKIYEKVDRNNNNILCHDEFLNFMKMAEQRPELETYWYKLMRNETIDLKINGPLKIITMNIPIVSNSSSAKGINNSNSSTNSHMEAILNDEGNRVISDVELAHFWQMATGDAMSAELVDTMMRSIFPTSIGEVVKVSQRMWRMAITSPINELFSPERAIVYQDMNQSLCHYLISSSSYSQQPDATTTAAASDDVNSTITTSSPMNLIQRLMHDLTHGCRYCEIDCYNGYNSSPVTNILNNNNNNNNSMMLSVKEVLEVVRAYGFRSSPYPIVLSFNIYCDNLQQKKLADWCIDILGGLLVDATLFHSNSLLLMPSPEALKNRIIIKAKFNKMLNDNDNNDSNDNTVNEYDCRPIGLLHHDLLSICCLSAMEPTEFIQQLSTSSSSSSGDLASRIPLNQVAHLDEEFLASLLTSRDAGSAASAVVIQEYTTTHLTTVQATHTESRSVNPTGAWKLGCQIACMRAPSATATTAANDRQHIRSNFARFRDNGNCGYVLKQSSSSFYNSSRNLYTLSAKNKNMNNNSTSSTNSSKGIRLTINILSGHQLPSVVLNDVVDPFVVVSISGVAQDVCEKRTAVILDNGYNPLWNEVFTFVISDPELAILHLTVLDEDVSAQENYSFVAFTAMPVLCIRQGFRVCSLYDEWGRVCGSGGHGSDSSSGEGSSYAMSHLMVRVSIEDM